MNKLFMVYDRPFWRDDGLNGQALSDLMMTPFVSDNPPPDGSVGVLMTFMLPATGHGIAQSVQRRDCEAGRHRALGRRGGIPG